MAGKYASVIGAGMVGLAAARALAEKGYTVQVFERSTFSVGASIRNFGMIWPIGQAPGENYDRAIRSREIWLKIIREAGIWNSPKGSLQLAYNEDEHQVIREAFEIFRQDGRAVEILNPDQTLQRSTAVVRPGLKAALYSPDEIIIDPRQAIPQIARYLQEKYGIVFQWNTFITRIEQQKIYSADKCWEADIVFVCSGADIETLYPLEYSGSTLTKCKLQMMRLGPQPADWRLGPAICGGLTLIHYDSFKSAPSLPALKKRLELEMPEYLSRGIHVMASQNGAGEVVVGDSHEYGNTFDPFDKAEINSLILKYLGSFARFPNAEIVASWHGIYPILRNGQTSLFLNPGPGIYLLNGVGGAGMTLSFAVAEERLHALF